ncbi:thiamine phosphate synthase [Microvirga massiliensis]|uniref:thiamine phosphate synthase n=1 Tax=Microvirga massiliensis TaxID=1033741 RepID=UPI00062BDFA1|nr:thiamine phosphate synthase [Microvirga massiliensis]
MTDSTTRLTLLTPLLGEAAFASQLDAACGAGDVAAVIARFAQTDERSLVKRIKALAPAAQNHGAALLISAPGEIDLAMVAASGGADGVHIEAEAGTDAVADLRERLKGERILGVGGVRSKHDAMSIGETGADYLLFGEPRTDGFVPPLDAIIERAAWWAEIFEMPCIAYAPTLGDVPAVAATGAEFVALGDAVWQHPQGPAEAVRLALQALKTSSAGR